jgi:predicted MFS family arabinose efflux permease
LVGGLIALAVSSVLFAFAPRLTWLFVARLIQGVADAVTWVVGFAVVADLYAADERGRVMGLVMSGSTAAFMIGPTIGGWLYQTGGPRLPYLIVALLSVFGAAGLALVRLPIAASGHQPIRVRSIVTAPAVAVCSLAVVVGGGTVAMLEPVFALFLAAQLGLTPSRIGLVFGAGAVVAAFLHPLFGRLADRTGGRRLTLGGLAAIGAMLPFLPLISSFASAVAIYSVGVIAISMMVAPSLAYMAEAVSSSGERSFGVAYGLYNFAWALGLLVGPSLGAAIYERAGFAALTWWWAPSVMLIAYLLSRASSSRKAPALVGH